MSVYQTTTKMNLSHRRRRPRLRIDVAASRGSGVQEFVGVSAAGWSSARFGQDRVRSSTVVSVAPSSARPVPGKSRTRPGTRHAVPEPRPRGSRFGDVTSDRIVPGGLARIERRWISSRWACTARGGMDSVELTWHYASRTRPAPAPAAPGLVREPARGRRGPGPAPRPIPSRSGRPASTSPNPRARTPGRRSRGLPGDLAARTASRWRTRTVPTARTARRRLRGRGAALHRCLRASRRLRGDRRGWLSTKRRTQTGAVRA